MSWNNPNQLTNSGMNNMLPAQKTPNKKLVFILVILGIILCSAFIIFVVGKGESNSDVDKAKAAARKEIPNAEAKQVVVADGFAMAIVYVPKSDSQLGSGNTTIFKVNQDESMTYLASASYFSPIDLLNFGIPLKTQAKLRETDVSDVKQELANTCNYSFDNTPGFSGFDGSFNPDGWQIDSASLDGITQTLDNVIKDTNANNNYDDKVICINTQIKDSDVNVDKTTFASTFKLKIQFITGNGAITDHDFTFTDGPIYSRTYTLDGQKIGTN